MGGKTKVMILDADEFIRRFLLHTLPTASTASATMASPRLPPHHLARCRRLLEAVSRCREPADNHTPGDRPLTAADFAICPDCGGTMRRIAAVPRSCNPQPFSCDTS
jgi:hypothetical protein